MQTMFNVMFAVLLAGTIAWAAEGVAMHEPFDGASIAGPWTKVRSHGATISVKDGWATFEAPQGAEDHIQQPAPEDNITLSAHLARWAGVYLVWNDQNWVGLGKISPTPFGRFYSIAVVDGKPAEIDHRGIDFNGRHDVRIQLGEDHVSFRYQLDGKWTDLRTIERPSGFHGAPKLVAAGIAYTDEDKPFGEGSGVGARGSGRGSSEKPHAEPEARNPKPETRSGAIDDLNVEPTPTDELKLSAAQLEAVRHPAPEPVNALLQKSDNDPTYDQIVGYYPPFRSPREIVGVPDHPKDIGVDWLGRIDVSPWTPPLAWFEIGSDARGGSSNAGGTRGPSPAAKSGRFVPLGEEGKPFTRRLLDGYLPLITLQRTIDDIDYTLKIFGWSEDFSPDKDLIAYARLTAKAHTSGAHIPDEIALVWNNGQKRTTWKGEGASEGYAQWCIRFTFPKPETAQVVSAEEFKQKWDDAASHWKACLAPAKRFDVPDQRVMEGYRAWLAYSMLDTDKINGYLEPHDGSGFYEEMFGYSVALHTMAMDQYGLHDRAAAVLKTQIHFQQPDGLYTQACGLCDPGSFLAALATHYEMTRDKAWLEEVAPAIIKQCHWLTRQREQSPKEGMLKGLIKFRPYNDYPAPTYNYLGNAWCARGMILCGAVLKDINNPEAERIAAEGEQYRKDLINSMEQSAFEDRVSGFGVRGSGKNSNPKPETRTPKPDYPTPKPEMLLPMEPDTHRLLKLTKNEGGDYWGLIASPILATDIMSPTDKPSKWIVAMLENRGGLIAGVCEFHRGIDHAYTYGYLLNALKLNQPRKTLLGFWSFLAFGMTRETYSPVECTNIKTGENQYTLPHLYSCTQQLRLLRAMLVREGGEFAIADLQLPNSKSQIVPARRDKSQIPSLLILGQGIPRAWLEPGKHVAVNKAPTTFGEVSYRTDPQLDGSIMVHIDPPTRHAPKEIRLYVREPGKRPIESVKSSSNDAAIPDDVTIQHSGEEIMLKNLSKPVDLLVTFSGTSERP